MNDDRKLVIKRVLNAPRSLVFAAWIDEKPRTIPAVSIARSSSRSG